MKILFVSHTLPLPSEPASNPGGMQRMSAEMRDALAEHPEVILESRVLESSARWAATRTPFFLGQLLAGLAGQVRRTRADVVLFSSMVTAATTLATRYRIRDAGAILAATPVGRDVTLPVTAYQRVVPRIFSALDLVLPISRATGEECLSRGLSAEKMEIVPVGIDTSRFPRVTDRAANRAALLRALQESGHPKFAADSLLLCSVGRHQERKGFHWFVSEVMPRLPGNVTFLLGGSGPMTEKVKSEIESHGLHERVILLGHLSEEMLTTLYRGADLFVMPNIPVAGDIEGFGVVMLEAGLSGLPIVAAELEGILDVVTSGKNGELVRSGDRQGFVEVITRFDRNRGLLSDLSSRAASHTAQHFAWPRVAERYVAALEKARARATSQ